jgi:thiamine kinase-like enzyme
MEHLTERIERLVGAKAVSWDARAASWQPANAVVGGNERFSVALADGRRVFVKAAQSEHMAAWLRREHEVYAHLRGSFIPDLVAFEDDPAYPLLVIEDLSEADWEPRWDDTRVELVRAALAEIAASPPPPNTFSVRETLAPLFGRWHDVEEDPAPFLSTGIRSAAWLERSLPALIAAAEAAPVDGDDLMHLDVRSDNICFRDGAAVLVDWNWCATGNGELDVAAWSATLWLEGGPAPWDLLPGGAHHASLLAGFWAAVVGLPPPATAPTVRHLQWRQLEVALEWCERELALA